MHIHVHLGRTHDAAGKFDESKHKRDGGKFARTAGGNKQAAPGARGAKPGEQPQPQEHAEAKAAFAEIQGAAVQAAREVRERGVKHPRGAKANELLKDLADARQLLDRTAPMSKQSAAYNAAIKKAEATAAELRKIPEDATPSNRKPDAEKKKPGKAPARAQGRRSGGGGGNPAAEVNQAISGAKKLIRAAGDPDAKTRDAAPSEGAGVYSSMRLSSASEAALSAWLAQRGLSLAYSPHVTVAYSRDPVPARAHPSEQSRGGLVVPSGGREMRLLGHDGEEALVLCLGCPELHARWQAWRDAGASWDYDGYTPHVTLVYGAKERGADALVGGEPFDEPITLMPERAEALQQSWAPTAEAAA